MYIKYLYLGRQPRHIPDDLNTCITEVAGGREYCDSFRTTFYGCWIGKRNNFNMALIAFRMSMFNVQRHIELECSFLLQDFQLILKDGRPQEILNHPIKTEDGSQK